MHHLRQFNAQAPQINREVYLSTLPRQHDWPFLIKEAPGIANLSGLKIYLKKVRNSELSEKNSSTAPTTQMEKDLMMRKKEFKSLLSEKSSVWMRETLTGLSYRKGKGFWQNFRHVFQMRENAIGPLQSSDGGLATSKEEISEELRKAFFLGQHLKGRSFDEDHYVEVTRRVRNQDPQINAEHEEHFHEDFSMYELECAIKDIPQSDAFDNDAIHASMLKYFGIRMKRRLLKLFNSCWHESTWHRNSSRVIFIKKPGKPNYAFSSSYRPITLSSHVGKIFEKMINRRLRTFFTSCKTIEEEQEGFREKRSTVRSLYRMQLESKDFQRKKKPAVLLNIDLEKAFDSVWIDGLMYKLQNIGITGNLISLIQAFLSNRLSFIKIGNYHSNNFPIHIGLPQGSVLSPTLFSLFINDFIDENPVRFKFADDTALILTADDILQLANRTQAAADNIKRWCDKWRMAVNGSKTGMVSFNYNSKDPLEIALNFDICKVRTSTKTSGN